MKKSPVAIFLAGLLMASVVRAQSVQDGINDYYAERYKGARATFEKLIAANPNNIDATYWLGQALIAAGDLNGARDVYSKALMASANAPLLIVGMGHVELIGNKPSEATQRFEAAITMTRGKKGDDPVILNAIGRAIVNTYTDKEKKGDINYAIEKLEAASQRDGKNAEIFLNLGNAYRKARPGEGGGKAFENYKKANEVNPSFAPPSFKLAQLFNSQRNRELYEEYLNETIGRDPRFAPAYYDLYYIKLGKLDFPAAQDMAAKYIANSDPDPQADHFKAQTYWAEKKYDEAISISKTIIANAGAQTKARTYILLADSYLSKGDTVSAKPYIDEYFARAKPEDITPVHYSIKSTIYSAFPGQEDVVFNSYVEGVKADTALDNKIDLLKKGAAFFKSKKLYDKESQLHDMIMEIKPNLTLLDIFNPTLSNYFAGNYSRSRELALTMIEKYPAEQYGYEWAFNNSRAVDTVRKDSIALPDALAWLEFCQQKDSVKYKKQIVNTSLFLVDYYANYGKDAAKALDYMKKVVDAEPANENYKKILEQLERSVRQSGPRSSNESRSSSSGTASDTPRNKKTG